MYISKLRSIPSHWILESSPYAIWSTKETQSSASRSCEEVDKRTTGHCLTIFKIYWKQTKTKECQGKKKTRNKAHKVTYEYEEEASLDLKITDDESEVDAHTCAECWENYHTTTRKDYWVQRLKCSMWLHESCLHYTNKCIDCGRQPARDSNLKTEVTSKYNYCFRKIRFSFSKLYVFFSSTNILL